ncbi:MAG: PAS domain S-box protein [Fimbriimonas sp.]|nr:PAS domain S-box protein [Fimbriimonas sp.]
MTDERPIPELSPRERQLLDYAAAGLTDTAIATKLGISVATVGTYWGRVRIKLGPYSRTELVSIVLRSERESALEALRQENADLIRRLNQQAETGDTSFYRDLMEHAPDAMVLVSANGTIQFANAVAHELFGYEPGALNGVHILELIPERLHKIHVAHRDDFVSNPQRRQMGEHQDTPAMKKDGTEISIRATLSAIEAPSGLVVICVIRQA